MNIENGVKSFNGNENQYKSMLLLFDSMTLDPKVKVIYLLYCNQNSRGLLTELK